jgi:hypothetical protein
VGWEVRIELLPATDLCNVVGMEPEPVITCIDCGGPAYLLTFPREDGVWEPGDLVTYRCRDCRDRWDLLLPEHDDAQPDEYD